MSEATLEDEYKKFVTVPFPEGLAGLEVDNIDIVLLDSEIAGTLQKFMANANSVEQSELKRLVRTVQYVLDHLKHKEGRKYFKSWEMLLLSAITPYGKEHIKMLIRNDLEENSDFKNGHGITASNINEHLIEPPIRKKFFNSFNNEIEDYWLVLDEDKSDKKEGYLIVWNEENGMFGLATKDNFIKPGYGAMIGWHGSFTNTLVGM